MRCEINRRLAHRRRLRANGRDHSDFGEQIESVANTIWKNQPAVLKDHSGNTIAFGQAKVHFRSRNGERPRPVCGRKCFLATSDRLVGRSHPGGFPPAADLGRGVLVSVHRGAGEKSFAPKSAPRSPAVVATPELFSSATSIWKFWLVANRFGNLSTEKETVPVRTGKRPLPRTTRFRQRRDRSDRADG